MRALLQAVLLRVATWLMWLASRFGHKQLAREETNALLAAAASQAIDDAEERRQARPPAALDRAEPPGVPHSGPSFEPPEGYVVMRAKGQLSPMFGNALLLVDEEGKRFVPIFVGGTEALAFRTRLERQPYKRPLTHDLFDSLLDRIGGRVVGMQVDELRGDVFYARLWIELAGGERLELDARPSDAIVLAIGAAAPILVAEEVLDRAGRRFDGTELAAPPSSADQPGEQ